MIIFEYIKLFYYLLHPKTIFIRWTSHALGDNLLLTLLLPELRKNKPDCKIVVESKFPELFENNPYPNWVTKTHFKTTKKFIKPKYRINKDTDRSIYQQMIGYIAKDKNSIGFPKLFLTDSEINKARNEFNHKYITIAPTGKMKFSANRKEWGEDNFQELVNLILANSDYKVVQIGSTNDQLLDKVIDARGKVIRESAAIISNSMFFIGLEGGLMHISKAVGNRSVIIYGGFINPEVSRYEENLNIINLVDCSPCFDSHKPHTTCESMKCMKEITANRVYNEIKTNFKLN